MVNPFPTDWQLQCTEQCISTSIQQSIDPPINQSVDQSVVYTGTSDNHILNCNGKSQTLPGYMMTNTVTGQKHDKCLNTVVSEERLPTLHRDRLLRLTTHSDAL